MPTTRPATVRRTAPHRWTFTIPGIATGTRRTWRQAYDDAHLIATLTARTPWPRNHPLPHRTPGQALAQLDAAWPKYQPAWPYDERRTPPDTCTDCEDVGQQYTHLGWHPNGAPVYLRSAPPGGYPDTEAWPEPATKPPNTEAD